MKPLLSQNVAKRFNGKHTPKGNANYHCYKTHYIQIDGFTVYLGITPSKWDSARSASQKSKLSYDSSEFSPDMGRSRDRVVLGNVRHDGFKLGDIARIEAMCSIANVPVDIALNRAMLLLERHYNLLPKRCISMGIRTHNNRERKRDRPRNRPIIR